MKSYIYKYALLLGNLYKLGLDTKQNLSTEKLINLY